MKQLLLTLISLGIFAGCATIKPKVQEAEIKAIRKVAIVGFTTLSEVPDTLEKMAPSTMGGVPNLNTFARQTDQAAKILKDFTQEMQTRNKWTILTPEQLIAQDVYGDLYTARMKNWKSMQTPDRAYQMHFVKNILPVAETINFTPDVRDHLMNSLKVDAIIEVQFKSYMNSGFSIGKIGNKTGKSVAQFRMFKKGIAEPIWDDQGAAGEESSKKLGFSLNGYNMSQEPALFAMYEDAAQLATVALLNRRDLKDAVK